MNREIKFKIWDNIRKIFLLNHTFRTIAECGLYNVEFEQYEYFQFTGVKDKDGREIYEGDILLIPDREFQKYAQVTYNNERACFLFEGRDSRDFFEFNEVTVAGNIFENPELIKKNKSYDCEFQTENGIKCFKSGDNGFRSVHGIMCCPEHARIREDYFK